MNYADCHSLTPQQIHEWTNIPIHIIEQAMRDQELANSQFSRKTRVATPDAVSQWVARFEGAARRVPERVVSRPQSNRKSRRPPVVYKELEVLHRKLDRAESSLR